MVDNAKFIVKLSPKMMRQFLEVSIKLNMAMDKCFELLPSDKRIIELDNTQYEVSNKAAGLLEPTND